LCQTALHQTVCGRKLRVSAKATVPTDLDLKGSLNAKCAFSRIPAWQVHNTL